MENRYVEHVFEPVYDEHSRILILGTMPSPKSREQGFYYSHPRNRFWPVMAEIFRETQPETPQEKRRFLLHRRIALWDVLKSCIIKGADDGSIRSPQANDISRVLSASQIKTVFTTGKKAWQLYRRHCEGHTGIPALCLPSTSPANCRNHKTLADSYSIILEYLPEAQRETS